MGDVRLEGLQPRVPAQGRKVRPFAVLGREEGSPAHCAVLPSRPPLYSRLVLSLWCRVTASVTTAPTARCHTSAGGTALSPTRSRTTDTRVSPSPPTWVRALPSLHIRHLPSASNGYQGEPPIQGVHPPVPYSLLACNDSSPRRSLPIQFEES